jgi:tRNA(adenine34) deaminase
MTHKSTHRESGKWVAGVKTDSTHPPEGLFTKSAATIARSLASKKVSPKGPASGMRMLTYFINRAGKGLDADRRDELEKAKGLLSKRIHRQRS